MKKKFIWITLVFALIAQAAIAGQFIDYIQSTSPDGAESGVLRLSNTDKIKWRNAADSADLSFGMSNLDVLQYLGVDLVDISSSQVLTNKDIDGGTASNTSRIIIPKDTTTNLNLLTDEEGSIAYDTTLGDFVFNNGSSWNQIGATTPALSVASKTAAYTATNSDNVILNDATTAAYTVTLFTAVGNLGHQLFIKKTDSSANLITIDANASETVDGGLTFVLDSQYDEINIVSDGANWIVTSLKVHGLKEVSATVAAYTTTFQTWGDLASLSTAQGTWNFDIRVLFKSNGTTTTGGVIAGLGTVSGNNAPGGNAEGVDYSFEEKAAANGTRTMLDFFKKGVVVSSTTTYYLKTLAEGSITNLDVAYVMTAERVR